MKGSKLVAIGLAAGAFLVLLWLVGGNAYARYREKQLEQAWVQSFGPYQNLLGRYPKTTTNDTARRLEKLAEPLGLDLTARFRESWSDALSTAGPGQKEDEKGWQAVSRYLTSQLEKPEATITAPPKDVEDFFAARGRDLAALAAELVVSPARRWESDPSLLRDHEPIPNLRALLRLQRSLLAGALASSANKNSGVPGQTLEASWRLNETLRERRELICQLIAVAITRLQVGALRKVEVDANLWRARLSAHNFRRSVFDAELLGLWPSAARYRQLEEIEARSERNPLKRLERMFTEPYGDMVWSEAAEKMRLAYLRIKDSAVMDKEVWEAGVRSERSAADILVSIQMPNLLDCFRRVDRLVIDTELTEKILQARQLRLENNLKWLPTVPGIEVTRFPGAQWIYSVSPQGTMSLSLSKEPHWDTSGPVLPTRFTSS